MIHKVVHENLRKKPRHLGPSGLLPPVLLDEGQAGLEVSMGDHARDFFFNRRLLQACHLGFLREERPFSALDCRQMG